MATTTLTVTLDEETVAAAERIAVSYRTDLPAMFRRYLSLLAAAEQPIDPSVLPPITRALAGILAGLPDQPVRELVTDALMEKYGLAK